MKRLTTEPEQVVFLSSNLVDCDLYFHPPYFLSVEKLSSFIEAEF